MSMFFRTLSMSVALLGAGLAGASLVGYWPLDGGGLDIPDSSGFENHGTLFSANASTWVGGVLGDALYFDGIRGPHCVHVEIPNDVSLQMQTAISFAAWVRCDDIYRDAPILAKEGPGGVLSYWFGVFGPAGAGCFGMLLDHDGYQGWDGYDRDQGAVPQGVWTHLASTWDGTTIRHYMNGQFVPGGISYSQTIKVANADLFIGANSGYIDEANATAFKGVIDEVRLYNHALSPVEVAALAVMPPVAIVRGRLTFQDYLGEPVAYADIQLRQGSMTEDHLNVPLAVDGSFELTTRRRGMWSVAAKASHWLRAQSEAVLVSETPSEVVPISLVNGDVDGDNAVTVFDYNVLSDAFDATPSAGNWVAQADLDGDLAVTVFDYNILSYNFDLVGN